MSTKAYQRPDTLIRYLRQVSIGVVGALGLVTSFSLSAQAANDLFPVRSCRSVFAPEPKTLVETDREVIARFQDIGRRVDHSVAYVDGRKDWPVDYEYVSGDPNQPLVILANGFVWPRENSAQMMNSFGKLATNGGRSFNLLRYDMSGQSKTVDLYKKDGPAPWYMSKDMTLDDLRHEMAEVAHQALKKNGLPADHPVIMMGLSYGRAVLSPELATQTKLVVELAPMMVSLDKYQASSAAWRATINMMKAQWWNPIAVATANQMQKSGWVSFYRNFYQKSPERLPPDVNPEYYIMGSALRTNAASDYDAREHIIPGAPDVIFVSQVDDEPLIKDQFDYFENSLSKKTNTALIYLPGVPHGQTANTMASDLMVATIANIDINAVPQNQNVFRIGVRENGSVGFIPSTIAELRQIQADFVVKNKELQEKVAKVQAEQNALMKAAQDKVNEMDQLKVQLGQVNDEKQRDILTDKILKLAEQINALVEQAKQVALP